MASQFQLVMRSGPTPGKVYELLQEDLTIGRDISNAIVINDPEISRRHSRLSAQAGSYVIEDLGSTNGTFVNGQRLMGPHMLRPGEVVMLGEHIGFAFETTYDPNATLATGSGPDVYRAAQPVPQTVVAPTPEQYEPAYQQPAYEPAYEQPAYQQPAYSGQVPLGPPEPYMDQSMPVYGDTMTETAPKRNWSLAVFRYWC
jgi:pSer/pThr/pTyr-binding forkhead associated (FHA) protein